MKILFAKKFNTMYTGLLHLHSFLRWIILILLLVNIFKHFSAGNKPFTAGDKKAGLFLMIAAHTTFLVGLYLWFAGYYPTLYKYPGNGSTPVAIPLQWTKCFTYSKRRGHQLHVEPCGNVKLLNGG